MVHVVVVMRDLPAKVRSEEARMAYLMSLHVSTRNRMN